MNRRAFLAATGGIALAAPLAGANACFGGEKRNRLFMTASQSLYAVYTSTR